MNAKQVTEGKKIDCQSCETVRITTPATTRRNGENVCDECAAEIDSRAAGQEEIRETCYDERGICYDGRPVETC